MYNHNAIKINGKNHMKSNSNTIVAAIIATLIGGTGSSSASFSYRADNSDLQEIMNGDTSKLEDVFSSVFMIVLFFVAIFSILLTIFIINVVNVGAAGWFKRSVNQENPTIGSIFSPFKNGFYLSTVGTMLLVQIYTFLWSLLCFIPGIIKGYAYSMVPYIKSDNPNLPASRCIEVSNKLTNGHKADLFYLDLSFIGWNFISVFTCGILGLVYVNPYYMSSKAFAYEALKAEAIQSGTLDEYVFNAGSDGYYSEY